VALGETSSRGTTMVMTLPVTGLTDDGRSGLPTARVELGRTRLA
jgi:hypothetical protein